MKKRMFFRWAGVFCLLVLPLAVLANEIEDALVEAYQEATSDGQDTMSAIMAMFDAAGTGRVSGDTLRRVARRIGMPDTGIAFFAGIERLDIREEDGKKYVTITNDREREMELPSDDGDSKTLILGDEITFEMENRNIEWDDEEYPGVRIDEIEGMEVEASVTADIDRLEFTRVGDQPKLRVKASWGFFGKTVEIDLPKPKKPAASDDEATSSGSSGDVKPAGEVGIVGSLEDAGGK